MIQKLRIRRIPPGMLLGILALAFLGQTGCRTSHWSGPRITKPIHHRQNSCNFVYADIDAIYRKARNLEKAENGRCVDLYFQVAKTALPEVQETYGCVDGDSVRVVQLYHSALAKIIETGQKFGRLDPINGLEVSDENGSYQVPCQFHGFVWRPEDFNEFILVGDYHNSNLLNAYRCTALGVPLVVERRRCFDEPMRKRDQIFSATVVLGSAVYNDSGSMLSLDFYDPLRVEETQFGTTRVGITRDLSAPFAYGLHTKKKSLDLSAFRYFGPTTSGSGLFGLEPYQRGKIPLIFVHGLLSDPTTWATMVNELVAKPEIMDRYQIWAFQYQTGESFVMSALKLREELAAAIELLDPNHSDPALSQIVMVGHSMGGLVAKLQITSSETRLWDSISNRPIDQIVASAEEISRLSRLAFFSPSPAVKRVVFIGTPHRGASMAQQLSGKIASCLVEQPEEEKAKHEALIRNNPGVFSEEVTKRLPTSIDIMKPNSCIVRTIEQLPIAPGVALHTIYGNVGQKIREPSDTVVPVKSARHANVVSELMMKAKHTELQRKPVSIDEIVNILRRHLHTANLPSPLFTD